MKLRALTQLSSHQEGRRVEPGELFEEWDLHGLGLVLNGLAISTEQGGVLAARMRLHLAGVMVGAPIGPVTRSEASLAAEQRLLAEDADQREPEGGLAAGSADPWRGWRGGKGPMERLTG